MNTLQTTPLAPGFLIASPTLQDPNFAGAVVLMVEHSEEGAIGFIINRTVDLTLETLLESVEPELLEAAEEGGMSAQMIHIGGPVQRHIAWVLYPRSEEDAPSPPDALSMNVGDSYLFGASMETLRDLIEQKRPGPFSVFLGYSGWGDQQLENEITQAAWLPLEFQEDLAFEVPLEDRYSEALKRLGLTPGAFIMGTPGASA